MAVAQENLTNTAPALFRWPSVLAKNHKGGNQWIERKACLSF